MLWDASALIGLAVDAEDGRLGTVTDFLFDDVAWRLRWMVVDTGTWLSGRKVLLPLSALGQPDPAHHHFPVKLTMEQVKDSPDIDMDQPVSRQIESHVYGYYDWDPYWGGSLVPMSNAMAIPFAAPLPLVEAEPVGPGTDAAHPNQGDLHLRSIAEITGYHFDAADGEIGHAADFLVDDAGWTVRFIVVDTTNWWPGEKVLISPLSVRKIDWAERLIHLTVDRQKVKDGPPYRSALAVDGAYEETVRTYYGIRGTAA